ncbi:DUF1049 domain-containing protein [Pseudomonas sp. FP2309]|uniref:DUF1049 domain-containing protein n=1 Tax=Pseudomonas sp. FP2309 TaxID=2954091 RepID=UPI0027353DD0|nr:DUF1049 domain-containing protein [Pseudomonas sp. FP2309]WLH70088.1 DUF1049 domain-containing protein [Pseudomonas sp. FP2309]
MHKAKRFLSGVVILLLTLVILAFVLENQQVLALSFFGWSTAGVPVSVILVLTFIAGMIIGPALGWLLNRKSTHPKH